MTQDLSKVSLGSIGNSQSVSPSNTLATATSLQWLGNDLQLVPNDIITVKDDASKSDFEFLRLLNNNSFINVSQSKLAESNFIQMITQMHAELFD